MGFPVPGYTPFLKKKIFEKPEKSIAPEPTLPRVVARPHIDGKHAGCYYPATLSPPGARLMPITQDRVIAILNAAQDYEQALSRAVGLIRTHAQQAKDGVITWQEAMETTMMLVSAGALLTRSITTNKTLAAERQHFKDFARRNERSARRMAEKRSEFGPVRHPKRQSVGQHQDYIEFIPAVRTTAPKEIQKEGRLYGSLLDDVDKIAPPPKYGLDPSLAEDEVFIPPLAGTLAPEVQAEIDRLSEAAVASHPGTVGEESGVDFEDEADEGTELDPAVAKDRGSEGRGSD
jgi:hypothetical protein